LRDTRVNAIPIRNVYYLLCYAWDQLAEGEVVDVSATDPSELADLFAHVLIGGIEHLVRRGMEQGYEQKSAELQGIRGKVDVLSSARRMLLVHGRTVCTFDELTPNTMANRILKSTVRRLATVPSIDRSLRHQLGSLYRGFTQIDDVALTINLFRTVQLHGNNRYYRFLLNICELVCSSLLVDEKSGSYRFRDFLREDRAMAGLFQSFVLNFLRRERPQLKPRAERIHWSATSVTDPDLHLLPGMTTDISLVTAAGRLIIDTKFYRKTIAEFHGSESVHSANLYQMFAYLMNAAASSNGAVSGMLLYPRVDRALRERYRTHDIDIHVCTIDLAQDWKHIRAELLDLVDAAVSAGEGHHSGAVRAVR
jgi:5-methylcytosine-specific restriction enzyme subunit McrC